MIRKMIAGALLATAALSPLAYAQEVGSNAYIDMYFGDWHASKGQKTNGWTVYPVFTKGDAMHPSTKGAFLRYVDGYDFAMLPTGTSSTSVTLSNQQQVYYFTGGIGTISAGSQSIPVGVNIAVLVPAGLAFQVKSAGTGPLTAYVITEPTPSGFTPGTKLVAKDENIIPISTTEYQWTRIVKPLFTSEDGLATITKVSTVTLDPLTITRPFVGTSHTTEELWMELSGTSIAFMGPFLRRQTPGMGYGHPPDNLAPTSNVNYSEDTQDRLLYVQTVK